MLPGERLDLIRAICSALWNDPYRTEVDDVLDEFGFPTEAQWSDDWDAYVRAMLRRGSEDGLLNLAAYLGVGGAVLSPDGGSAALDVAVPSIDRGPWPTEGLRVFLSHISAEKAYVSDVKRRLERFHIWGFVAHQDIEPTREWALEIERALRTCDALVAFLHHGFNESAWTDQEVGFVVGRGVPIISVRAGLDPYGFIGRYQALPFMADAAELADRIVRLLMAHPATGQLMGHSLVAMMDGAVNFADARSKVGLLRVYTGWTPELLERLTQSIDRNSQVGNATGVPEAIRTIVAQHS